MIRDRMYSITITGVNYGDKYFKIEIDENLSEYNNFEKNAIRFSEFIIKKFNHSLDTNKLQHNIKSTISSFNRDLISVGLTSLFNKYEMVSFEVRNHSEMYYGVSSFDGYKYIPLFASKTNQDQNVYYLKYFTELEFKNWRYTND